MIAERFSLSLYVHKVTSTRSSFIGGNVFCGWQLTLLLVRVSLIRERSTPAPNHPWSLPVGQELTATMGAPRRGPSRMGPIEAHAAPQRAAVSVCCREREPRPE